MASTIKQRLRRYNGTDYDTIHLETQESQIVADYSKYAQQGYAIDNYRASQFWTEAEWETYLDGILDTIPYHQTRFMYLTVPRNVGLGWPVFLAAVTNYDADDALVHLIGGFTHSGMRKVKLEGTWRQIQIQDPIMYADGIAYMTEERALAKRVYRQLFRIDNVTVGTKGVYHVLHNLTNVNQFVRVTGYGSCDAARGYKRVSLPFYGITVPEGNVAYGIVRPFVTATQVGVWVESDTAGVDWVYTFYVDLAWTTTD